MVGTRESNLLRKARLLAQLNFKQLLFFFEAFLNFETRNSEL